MCIGIWLPLLLMAGASLISLLLGNSLSKDKVMSLSQDLESYKLQNNTLLEASENYKNQLTDSASKFQSLSIENNALLADLANVKAQVLDFKNNQQQVKEVIKEVPVEVLKEIEIVKEVEIIKEVPVERERQVIKEVEVIKEVPVEVIKEVEVIKKVEVIKEITVEVPVEVIKEIEIIKEVPVELIVEKEVIKEVIKEVPVEIIKEVEVEVIREVPIEIIKEVEVVKKIDLDQLRQAMEGLDTFEVSKTLVNETRTKLESDIVERRVLNRDPNRVDNLKRIEGIGPKISGILNKAGIKSYWALSDATPEVLKDILIQEGPKYKMHNPSSWPKQARLAAEGKWNELQKLQNELNGGQEE